MNFQIRRGGASQARGNGHGKEMGREAKRRKETKAESTDKRREEYSAKERTGGSDAGEGRRLLPTPSS